METHFQRGVIMEQLFGGIPETMLIPLWAKARENQQKKPIVKDPLAAEILSRIDYDFSRFDTSRLSQTGISVRTEILDNQVEDFLKRKPDSIIINLGAGLDTRPARFDESKFHCWYDLDLPQSIGIRRNFFKEGPKKRFIPKSVFDKSWLDDIPTQGKEVLIIAEGLFMYFEEEQVMKLFQLLVQKFPGAEMLLEMLAPFLTGKSKKHDSLKKLTSGPEFHWSLSDSTELELWHRDILFLKEWNYFNYHKKRWGIMGYLGRFPPLRSKFASRIIQLRFNGGAQFS